MSVAKRLRQYLDQKAVTFDTVAHPRTLTSSRSAQAAHIPGDRLAKAVIIHHELGYVAAIAPSTHRIELGALQGILERRLGLATEAEITELFDDCDQGAVPPLGQVYGIEVIVDDSLSDLPEVYFEGGDHRTLVHMRGDVFRSLLGDAQHGQFSHRA